MKRKPQWSPAPAFIEVASSAVGAIAYDRRSRTLSVRFISGEVYDYWREKLEKGRERLSVEARDALADVLDRQEKSRKRRGK
jgi:hypothetical protein